MINNSMNKKETTNTPKTKKISDSTMINTGLLIQSHLKISDAKSGEILLKKRA